MAQWLNKKPVEKEVYEVITIEGDVEVKEEDKFVQVIDVESPGHAQY